MAIPRQFKLYLASALAGIGIHLTSILALILPIIVYAAVSNSALPELEFNQARVDRDPINFFIQAGLVAPIIENFIFPLSALAGAKLGNNKIVPYILVASFAFFSHGMGALGGFAMFAFIGFYLVFVMARRRASGETAYVCSVIAHSFANMFSYTLSNIF